MIKKVVLSLCFIMILILSKNVVSAEIGINKLNLEDKTELKKMFTITTHKLNYFLPYTYTTNINKKVYEDNGYKVESESFDSEEVEYQLSLKMNLINNTIVEGDSLYVAFSINSWWQVYNSKISRPFRETNYSPELFYLAPLGLNIYNTKNWYSVGLEHDSNGQTNELSRSWNKLSFSFINKTEVISTSLKFWHRIEEEEKIDKHDSTGDDNPDIEDFYGNFELENTYNYNDFNFKSKIRYNPKTTNGFFELAMLYALNDRVNLYIEGSTGYGESLLDYNHKQSKIGIGFAISKLR